jgi:cell division protease FtsH
MRSTLKTLLKASFLLMAALMAVFAGVILLWMQFQNGKASAKELDYTSFLQAVQEGRVTEATISDDQDVTGKFRGGGEYPEGSEFKLQLPFKSDSAFIQKLEDAKVVVHGEKTRENPLIAILFTWAPVLLIVAVSLLLLMTLVVALLSLYPRRRASSAGMA